jgi:hypothetical protein
MIINSDYKLKPVEGCNNLPGTELFSSYLSLDATFFLISKLSSKKDGIFLALSTAEVSANAFELLHFYTFIERLLNMTSGYSKLFLVSFLVVFF